MTSLAEVSLIQEMGRAREEPRRQRLERTRSWAHLERPPPQAVRRCRSEPSGFCFAEAARREGRAFCCVSWSCRAFCVRFAWDFNGFQWISD